MNYLDSTRLDALAAQYVLGTLSRRARRRFGRLARDNESVAAAIRAWEDRLMPLAESVPPIDPPARVWSAILRRIQQAREARGARQTISVWANLGLWRALTLAGFATALALSVILLTSRNEQPAGTLVVVLAGQDAKSAMVASAERSGRILTLKSVIPAQPPADRVLQLWALPAAGNPQSLGVLPGGTPSGVVRVNLSQSAEIALQNTQALAISLEPQGGSPTGLPTGPVLYSGPVQRLY